ncbi:hypothetical protein FF011L_49210 [Roseimaritima multifibrata]|uniref:PEP-CTERM protein-sorting domain-containing protein n=1 Tax=Roseimaritima multifibrata TaxID=1930274 RepID=A0A517MMK7_9BACT|nr:hypothetical protein [Roseimaritima multifibrata]QDS96114.1 hypothetical protein FF011L_49210 [Roseimaritima multifibrata]
MNDIRLCRWVAFQAIVLGILFAQASPVLAGFGIKADFEGTRFQGNGREAVKVKLAGHGRTNVYVDELKWKVTESTNAAKSAVGSVFSSFCIALPEPAISGTRYQVQDVAVSQFGSGASFLCGRQLTALGSLFYNFYDRVTNGATAAAFQLAVWEIVYDTSGRSSRYDVTNGNFQAENQRSIRRMSNDWLGALTNNGVPLRIYTTNRGQSQIGMSPPVPSNLSAVPEPFSAVVWSVLGCVAGIAGWRRRRSHTTLAI